VKGLRISAGVGVVLVAVALGLFSLAMLLAGFVGVERSVPERLGFRMTGLLGIILSPFWVASGISWLRPSVDRGR
jgi:hypothetical protein